MKYLTRSHFHLFLTGRPLLRPIEAARALLPHAFFYVCGGSGTRGRRGREASRGGWCGDQGVWGRQCRVVRDLVGILNILNNTAGRKNGGIGGIGGNDGNGVEGRQRRGGAVCEEEEGWWVLSLVLVLARMPSGGRPGAVQLGHGPRNGEERAVYTRQDGEPHHHDQGDQIVGGSERPARVPQAGWGCHVPVAHVAGSGHRARECGEGNRGQCGDAVGRYVLLNISVYIQSMFSVKISLY